ncbi:hypothetical protein COLO4_35524 [Corchorus olitorius]|uniref:Uncharacterized protein n=1 Tax=Corchorus olitorius TaxID=93759 RepID=A0A1R3GFT0_9ROSI|nr:hypothetical protein COLO4_35524 [Corchorus olitorius]
MEDFSHVIQDSASSLSAVQRERFLIEVSSIRKLQKAIRQLIATMNDPIILATHRMREISQEFIAIKMMLMKYGILNYRPRADEEFINSLKMRCSFRLVTSYYEGFTLKFKLTEPERHALINIPVRDGLRLAMTLQPLYVLIERLLEMQSTILSCSLSPESVRAS